MDHLPSSRLYRVIAEMTEEEIIGHQQRHIPGNGGGRAPNLRGTRRESSQRKKNRTTEITFSANYREDVQTQLVNIWDTS